MLLDVEYSSVVFPDVWQIRSGTSVVEVSGGSVGRRSDMVAADQYCGVGVSLATAPEGLTGLSHLDMPTYNGAESPPAIQSAVASDKAD